MTEIVSPYVNGHTEWRRANFHTHTAESPDASRPVAEVVTEYEIRGYDILGLTDHDTVSDLADLRDTSTMTLISGTEVTSGGTHVIGLGVDDAVTPHPDRQAVLDTLAESDGLAVLPHPNRGPGFDHYTQDALQRLDGFAGIEICNGSSRRKQGSSLATDRWDQLLSDGHVVWGYAADDSHRPHDWGTAWTMIQATDPTPRAALTALRNGRCYASTGVSIESLSVTDSTLTVKTAAAATIRLVADHGRVHRTVESPTAVFDLPADLQSDTHPSYVRVECYGSGTKTAWTQPFFLDGRC
jgi:Predicted metal-dependent phosphoesterases (PHP family)